MSHWADLRARTRDRLVADGVAGCNVRASRFMPTKDADLPIALVHVRRESMAADGGARSGAAAFVNSLDLRVQVRLSVASDEALEPALDEAVAAVLAATIQSDAWWGEDVEGVDAIDITYDEAETGSYVGQAEIAITVLYRSIFEPATEDDLATVAVTEPGTGSGVKIDNLDKE